MTYSNKLKNQIFLGLLTTFFFTPLVSKSQLKWPQITQQTKPWSRWWWEGSAVNNKDLDKVMEKYQQAGLGGMELTAIYGVKGEESKYINYLSDKWMDVFEHTLQEGEKLGLGIDLANATGWPFGGPWVTPADESKELRYEIFSVNQGEQLKEPVVFIQKAFISAEGHKKININDIKRPISANTDLQQLALDQVRFQEKLPLVTLMAFDQKGNSLNLTKDVDANGKLNWTAPKGDWKLYAVFQGMHGKMVERAAPGGEGFVIDHLSKTAVTDYLHHFDTAFGNRSLKNLRSFFCDSYEVDDANGQADFTPHFFEYFQKARGYDLRQYLPYLLNKSNDEKSDRVLSDFRQTIGELLLKNFTQTWEGWAKSKGKIIRNQSHGSPANILDLYGASDIPETEGEDRLRFKFATSAANVLGKPLASSESATWLNEHFKSTLGEVKNAIDNYFLGGVNHIFYHGIAYSPLSAPWPGWLFYASVHFSPANPQWNNFATVNAYIARCQSFLQMGHPNNDILQYYPLFDSYADRGRSLLKHYDGMKGFENTDFDSNATWMLANGYSFDFISDNQTEQLQNNANLIQSAGGDYQTILVSNVHYMPLSTLQKIMSLAKSGASILIYKSLPSSVPGLANLTQRQNEFNALLHSLSFQQNAEGISVAKVGRGRIIKGDDLPKLLQFSKIRREKMVSQDLHFVRRSYNGGNYYFVVNESGSSFTGWVPLAVVAKSVAVFNPMSQALGFTKTKVGEDGNVEIYLQLQPNESCILKTNTVATSGKQYPYFEAQKDTQTIDGKWTLTFISGGPVLPKPIQLKHLDYWTNLDENELNNFSGTADYQIDFKKPDAGTNYWKLNLGNVKENAEVWLNGKNIGTLLNDKDGLIIANDLFKQRNHLDIKVSNLMANRIRYMDQNNILYKRFYNINFPAHDPKDIGKNGLFTAKNWDVSPSGLAGPVTLTPLKEVE